MADESESGPFWENIGQVVVDHVGNQDGILMYLECERAVIGGQIYRENPDDVEQIDPPGGIMDSVLAHWEELDTDKRWAAVRYLIDDGRFKVTFDYIDEPLAEGDSRLEDFVDRIRSAYADRFGDKPVRPNKDRWK